MAINDLAAQLIHDLRFDAHTRKHFSISAWDGRNTCKTVGCIAGTAIIRAANVEGVDAAHSILMNSHRSDIDHRFGDLGYVGPGAWALGISSKYAAEQMFMPFSHWHPEKLRKILSHNERPDLSTVEKMVAFASNLPDNAFHPTHCANTLENLLKHERAYVDWAEGWEDA